VFICSCLLGTVVNKTAIKQYQQATRDRAKVKTEGGKIIRCVRGGQSRLGSESA